MLEDLYQRDVFEWLKAIQNNPKIAAIKLALYELEENSKLSDKEVLAKWRIKSTGPYGKNTL